MNCPFHPCGNECDGSLVYIGEDVLDQCGDDEYLVCDRYEHKGDECPKEIVYFVPKHKEEAQC